MANPELHKLDSASAKFHTAYVAEAEAHRVLPVGFDGSNYFTLPLTAGGASLKVDATFTGSGTFTSAAEHVEDTAHASGDTGSFALGIRRDSQAELADTEGDYIGHAVSRFGEQYVTVFGTLPISDGGGVITVDGTVGISGTVAISAASLPLPTGASTLAEQQTQSTTLSAISGKLPATLGQKAMVASLAVVVASDQSAIPVSGTVAISGTVPVSGTVAVSSLPALVAGTANIGDVDVLTLPALPAGTNNIGDVDVLTVPADPFGANADAASATGSISAKLRFIASTGIPVTGTVTVDTELPAAAALSDTIGNPTTPMIGAAGMVWTGSVWVRQAGTIAGGNLVTLAAGTNTNEVVGDVASGVAITANPVTVGARASLAAPTAVADGQAVNVWAQRNGAVCANIVAAGVLIPGDATNGLDVDVTRLPALVAGTANIGDVDVLTVPADPFGANADAASATGSISAKLRSIAAVQLPAALAAGGGLKIEGVASGVAVNVSDAADKAEDAAHSSGATGQFILGVRNDTGSTALTNNDGDYSPIATTSFGGLWVQFPSAQLVNVSGGVALISTPTDYPEDSAHASGDVGTFVLGVRNDLAATVLAGANGDYSPLATDDRGRQIVTAHMGFASRSDTYTGTANGTTLDISARPCKHWAVLVKGTGGAATTWTVGVQLSLDGVNFTEAFQHTQADGDGFNKTSGLTYIAFPALYCRTRCNAGLVLGAASNIVVTILGVP